VLSASPDYMPGAARDVSARLGDEHCIGLRLRTNPRMRWVWRKLVSEGRKRELSNSKDFEDRLDSLPDLYRMEAWDAPTCGVSLAHRACAAFFLATAIIFAVRNQAVTESKVARELKRWRDGAALCREALHAPHRASVDRALSDALSASAAYFEGWAKVLTNANMNSTYLIERASGEERDDIRAQVRHVATVTREIFGSFMYGTVATAASTATGFPISPKDVENWCHDDLSLPSH